MNFKSTLICLGLIAGSTVALPTEAQAIALSINSNTATKSVTFDEPIVIDSIQILTPRSGVTAVACLPGLRCTFSAGGRISSRPSTLTPRARYNNPFGGASVKRLILRARSGSSFRVKVRTVPEPSTVLGTLVVGTLGASLLQNRKQRQTQ
ncbi:PEP-CTERM sorting domain-containing protein [Oculatella sp. FACHB-28]|nr:PEP-CTERM sorting domain-containing protein [Oculatella sp. FACHB-28]